MEARSLDHILTLPKKSRFAVIAEGLLLLAEHVGALHTALLCLHDRGETRGAAAIDALASEEAAKVLILLDVVRMGWSDQAAVGRQLKRFYSHLARGIYARVVHGRPADRGEVRDYVDTLRQSHFLDGPGGVDWIFRNEVLSEREDSLYVDYVSTDGGDYWTTPANRTDYLSIGPSPIIELAIALDRVGCLSLEGLHIMEATWRGQTIEDNTHWRVIEGINRKVVDALNTAGLVTDRLTRNDVRLIYEQWTFPLGGIDLQKTPVAIIELRARQDKWLADQDW